jgi:hypothetical protein
MHVTVKLRTGGRVMAAAGLVCGLLLGCAAPPREPSPDEFVFYKGDPGLQRVQAPAGVFLYTNPRKPLTSRERFIVSPAQVTLNSRSAYAIDPAQSKAYAEFLRKEVIASLSERYKVVDTPENGVLRVTLALADIRRREPVGHPYADPQFQPMLIMSITDTMTGEAIALVRDLNRGHEFAKLAATDAEAARGLLSDWARTLRERLEQAEQAAGNRPTSQP